MYCGLSGKINMREMHGPILFAFVSACVIGKNLKPSIEAPWLTMPLHRAVLRVPGSPFYICATDTLLSYLP